MKTKLLLIVLTALVMLSCSVEEDSIPEITEENMYVVTVAGIMRNTVSCGAGAISLFNMNMSFFSEDTEMESEHYGPFNYDGINLSHTSYLPEGNIGVTLTLTDFDPLDQSSGEGSGFINIIILISKYGGGAEPMSIRVHQDMYICYNSYPKVILNYNTQTREYTIEQEVFHFD